MTVDVDRLLHDHFAPARRAALPPDSWARLEDRLATGGGAAVGGPAGGRTGGGRPASRPWARRAVVLAVAAAIAVVGAVVVTAGDGDDDDRVDTADVPPPTGAPDPSPSPDPRPDPGPTGTAEPTWSVPPMQLPAPGPRPQAVVVLLDRDGDGLGEVARLAEDGTVTTLVPEADDSGGWPEGGPTGASALDVAPDGVVYYETCCEPAVGAIHAYDPATGTDLGMVAHGVRPAVSPDGSLLAVAVIGLGIQIIDVSDLTPDTPAPAVHTVPLGALGDGGGLVTGLAWSPDGQALAVGRYRADGAGAPTAVGVDLVDIGAGTSTPLAVAGEDEGLAFPAFLADGRLVVGTSVGAGADVWSLVAASLVAVDLETGQVDVRRANVVWPPGDEAITAVDVSADGQGLIVTDAQGRLWASFGWDPAGDGPDLLTGRSRWGSGAGPVLVGAW